jgi:hypothetical protein
MTLEQFFQDVETRVLAWSKHLWPQGMAVVWRSEVEQLSRELQQHYDRAVHYCSSLEEVRARLADNEVKAAVLASRIETCVHIGDQPGAWRQALELDRLRQQITADRARLAHDDKAYRFHRTRIDELERRLTLLQEKLSSSHPRAS